MLGPFHLGGPNLPSLKSRRKCTVCGNVVRTRGKSEPYVCNACYKANLLANPKPKPPRKHYGKRIKKVCPECGRTVGVRESVLAEWKRCWTCNRKVLGLAAKADRSVKLERGDWNLTRCPFETGQVQQQVYGGIL